MRSKNIVAAFVVAMGLGTGLATVVAIPASADPSETDGSSQTDQAFLQFLGENGLTVKSDAFAIELAHSTCDVLNQKASVTEALQHVKKATKWKDVNKIGNFGGAAVQAYCPKSMPR